LNFLDSRFHGNDGKGRFRTFYEPIKLEMQQQEAAPASFIPPATTSPIMTAKITFFMSITSF